MNGSNDHKTDLTPHSDGKVEKCTEQDHAKASDGMNQADGCSNEVVHDGFPKEKDESKALDGIKVPTSQVAVPRKSSRVQKVPCPDNHDQQRTEVQLKILRRGWSAFTFDQESGREFTDWRGIPINAERTMTKYRHCGLQNLLRIELGYLADRIRQRTLLLVNDQETRVFIPTILSPLVEIGVYKIVFPEGGIPYFFIRPTTEQIENISKDTNSDNEEKVVDETKEEEELMRIGHARHLPPEIKSVGELIAPKDLSETSYIQTLGGFPLDIAPGTDMRIDPSVDAPPTPLQTKMPLMTGLLDMNKPPPKLEMNDPILAAILAEPVIQTKDRIDLFRHLSIKSNSSLVKARKIILQEAYRKIEEHDPKLAEEWARVDTEIISRPLQPEKIVFGFTYENRKNIIDRVLDVLKNISPVLHLQWIQMKASAIYLPLAKSAWVERYYDQIPRSPVTLTVYTVHGTKENTPPTSPRGSQKQDQSSGEERDESEDQESSVEVQAESHEQQQQPEQQVTQTLDDSQDDEAVLSPTAASVDENKRTTRATTRRQVSRTPRPSPLLRSHSMPRESLSPRDSLVSQHPVLTAELSSPPGQSASGSSRREGKKSKSHTEMPPPSDLFSPTKRKRLDSIGSSPSQPLDKSASKSPPTEYPPSPTKKFKRQSPRLMELRSKSACSTSSPTPVRQSRSLKRKSGDLNPETGHTKDKKQATQAPQKTTQTEQQAAHASQEMTQIEEQAVHGPQEDIQTEQQATHASQEVTQTEQQAAHASQEVIQTEQQAAEASQEIIQTGVEAAHAPEELIQTDQQADHASEEVIQAKTAHASQEVIQTEQQAAHAVQEEIQSEQQASHDSHEVTETATDRERQVVNVPVGPEEGDRQSQESWRSEGVDLIPFCPELIRRLTAPPAPRRNQPPQQAEQAEQVPTVPIQQPQQAEQAEQVPTVPMRRHQPVRPTVTPRNVPRNRGARGGDPKYYQREE